MNSITLTIDLINQNVPQILINREQLHHMEFDVEMYGNCDDVICYLCNELGSEWVDVVGTYKSSFVNISKTKKSSSNFSELSNLYPCSSSSDKAKDGHINKTNFQDQQPDLFDLPHFNEGKFL